MKFITFFSIFLKKYLKNPLLVVSLILMPLCVFLTVELSEKEFDNNFQILIYFEEKNDLADEIYQKLTEIEYISFKKAKNYDEVKNSIINGEVEIGYIFKENFQEDIENLDLKQKIETIYLQDNSYAKFSNLLVFASIFEQLIPYIVENELKNYEIYEEIERIEQEIQKKYKDNSVIELSYFIEDEIDNEIVENIAIMQFISGEICIFLLIFSLIACIYILKSDEEVIMLTVLSDFRLQIYKSAPIYFLSTIFAIISIYIVKLNYIELDLGFEILKLICYQAMLFLSNFVFSRILSGEILVLFMPLVVIAVIISHPILIDISIFIPQIKVFLKYLPTFQYIYFDFNIFIMIFITLCTISIALDKIKN